MTRSRLDLVGRVFGRLTVLNQVASTPGDRARDSRLPHWRCQCACGKIASRVAQSNLLSPAGTRSCGCLRQERVGEHRPWQRRNLLGQRFGHLVVVQVAPHVPSRGRYLLGGHTAWTCECDCGRRVVVKSSALTRKRGPRRNCGCRFLLPDAPPLPASWTARHAAANGNGNGHQVDTRPVVPDSVLPVVPDRPEKTTGPAEYLRRIHDEQSPIGAVRRIDNLLMDDEGDTSHCLCLSDDDPD